MSDGSHSAPAVNGPTQQKEKQLFHLSVVKYIYAASVFRHLKKPWQGIRTAALKSLEQFLLKGTCFSSCHAFSAVRTIVGDILCQHIGKWGFCDVELRTVAAGPLSDKEYPYHRGRSELLLAVRTVKFHLRSADNHRQQNTSAHYRHNKACGNNLLVP